MKLSVQKKIKMSHLIKEQRYTISCMVADNTPVSKIAKTIGVHRSTVYSELKRNRDKRDGKYYYDLAERKCRNRHKKKPKNIKFTSEIKERVDYYLRLDYSPEQVVGTLRKEEKQTVSVERIYQYIWEDKAQNGDLYSHLRRQGRKYRNRGSLKDNRGLLKNRVCIDNRPKEVEQKKRFGDLEVDLIIGANHNQAILTINDRASGMLKMKKVHSKEASVVTLAINELLEDWTPYIHTITADNGKEFAGHEIVAETLNIDYYFAHPYHSWERGANENLNGLIRQYFKKGSSFVDITDMQIKDVELKLNNRPRKRFNYETPIFVMNNLLFNQSVAFIT